MVLNNEIMITLIRNSCKNLSDWARRSENKKIEWLADNISQRSELIYFEIEQEDGNKKDKIKNSNYDIAKEIAANSVRCGKFAVS